MGRSDACDAARRPLLWWIVNVARWSATEAENDALIAAPEAVARGAALCEQAFASRGLRGEARVPPCVLRWIADSYGRVYAARPRCPRHAMRLIFGDKAWQHEQQEQDQEQDQKQNQKQEQNQDQDQDQDQDLDQAAQAVIEMDCSPEARRGELARLKGASEPYGAGLWKLARGGRPQTTFSRMYVDRHYTPGAAS